MIRTIWRDMLARRGATRSSTLVVSLLSALGACSAIPLPVAAQPGPPVGTVLEGYVGRSRLDRGVAGQPARLDAVGARLLVPVGRIAPDAPRWLAERVAVGGFLASATAGERELAARHYGFQADVRLASHRLAGRVEPLASLGIGGFRAHREASSLASLDLSCLKARQAGALQARCATASRPDGDMPGESLALSPALGVRVALVPGLALRVDARDVIVHRGAPRHNPELALGLSIRR